MNVAAAQLRPVAGDLAANAAAHVGLIADAAAAGARVVVFPELSLTGYELERLAGDPLLWLAPDDVRLAPIRSACRVHGALAVVGAAVRDGDRRLLAAVAVDDRGAIAAVYAKRHLHGAEHGLFDAGDEHVVLEVDGLRLGLAVCADAAAAEHAAEVAALGADAYLVGALFDRGTEERLGDQMSARARDHAMWVVLGSLEGPAGALQGCGGSGVWAPDGRAVVQLRDEPRGIAVTEIGPGAS